MRRITRDQFEARLEDYHRCVASTSAVDPFCARAEWILPAHDTLSEPRELYLYESDCGYLCFARHAIRDGMRVLEPLEAGWGLASPVVGQQAVAEQLEEMLVGCRSEWSAVLIPGLYEDSRLLRDVSAMLHRRFELRIGASTPRYIADISDGIDGFLGRRSKNFRRALRRAEARAREEGMTVEAAPASTTEQAVRILDRVVSVETRSWKAEEGTGIDHGPMLEFYRSMAPMLAEGGALRCAFARVEGRDVGYILGGVVGARYRGLQFSYVAEYREWSVGNVMQRWQIDALASEGITDYDLGSEAAYKSRWADRVVRSPVLVGFAR